jgi:cytochrome c553
MRQPGRIVMMIGLAGVIIWMSGRTTMALAQGDATAGEQLFVQSKCGNCHGQTGKGDGSVAIRQNIPLLDWTDAAAMAKITDAYMTDIIEKGGKAIGKSSRMPRYGHKLSTALARQHNNANICSLPARFISIDLAKQIVDAFLSTDFEGGRHQIRIDKIPTK